MPGTDEPRTPAARRSPQRRALEAQSDAARARLCRGLDALLDRKERLLHPAAALRRHPRAAIALGGAAAVLIAAGVGLATHGGSTRRERARRASPAALGHARARRGFFFSILESCASAAVVAVARHFAVRLLTAPPPLAKASGLRAERDPFPSVSSPR